MCKLGILKMYEEYEEFLFEINIIWSWRENLNIYVFFLCCKSQLEKYNIDENNQITCFKHLKLIMKKDFKILKSAVKCTPL